jgi:hypothetical protein
VNRCVNKRKLIHERKQTREFEKLLHKGISFAFESQKFINTEPSELKESSFPMCVFEIFV